ncbi:uncharacterized protein CCR75_005754 [Bremia lactucae]|uniref:Dynamin GTPase n=1 Tax=Bremia lactucae TaxID=4779 RepID=A0A976FFV9_BRELC|nr:hypothetical protein CCR75_005754 [Bremia lactucae]
MSKNGLLTTVKAQEERHLVDKLRNMGLAQYIELPQIAVMGDTSSGKSSLLSALSGVSFPSNDQLTTRCPTQLILTRAPTFHGTVRLVRFQRNGGDAEDEAKEELNRLEDVPDAITKLTQKLVDEGQYISDDQIVIEMCGPELPDLTLTDLPGLVRTVGDHEDESIISRVREMVDRYMRQERTVIIAVVPANVDMHNTEILQAAQQADPNGTRTIAVVTKVDLVDAGAEMSVHELLLNKKKKMHLGYHAVKCRNQRELTAGTSIEKGLANEMTFFNQHEYWCQLPSHLWGIPTLTKRLVSILQDNIRRSLPKVITEMNTLIADIQNSLSSLGTPLETPGAQRQQFGKWADHYLRLMEAAMEGRYELLPSASSAAASHINARLRAVIRIEDAAFQKAIEDSKNPKSQDSVAIGDLVEIQIDDSWRSDEVKEIRNDSTISTASSEWNEREKWRYDKIAVLKRFIRENRGDELAIFTSYQVFCNLFRQYVDKWGPPAEKLLNAYGKQTKMVSDFVSAEIHATSRVVQFLRRKATEVLNRVVEAASQETKSLLLAEGRPYTQDMRLFEDLDKQRFQALEKHVESEAAADSDGKVSLSQVMNVLKSVTMATEDREALEMEVALKAYLDVAIPRFVDAIPMRLNDLILRTFVTDLTNELNGLTDQKLARLMQDSEQKVLERQRLKDELACLVSAKKEIELVC